MFDIEFYQTAGMRGSYVELKCMSFVSQSIDFVLRSINNDNKDVFKHDCEEIEDLRSWLWGHDNNICSSKECSDKFGILLKELRYILKNFSIKWGLCVNED